MVGNNMDFIINLFLVLFLISRLVQTTVFSYSAIRMPPHFRALGAMGTHKIWRLHCMRIAKHEVFHADCTMRNLLGSPFRMHWTFHTWPTKAWHC